MKYLILVGDGMADRPVPELGGKTPLAVARIPHMDRLAAQGETGLAVTIPEGMDPGSDTANMSLMGYDPKVYHTGRSPIEAAAMGVDLAPGEIAFRCNLVTLGHGNGGTVMDDYSAGHIDSATAAELILDLDRKLGGNGLKFHPGVSYRHLLVWREGPLGAATVPPHDYIGREVGRFLPEQGELGRVAELTRRSWEVLSSHPLNQKRGQAGQAPANSIWLWGQGTKPDVPTMGESYGISGLVISAVDLVKGLGVLAGLEVPEIEGATGDMDTNYQGKVDAALKGLERLDLAFVHVEAPDEAGHSGVAADKVKAIELFDSRVVGPIMAAMEGRGDFRVLLAPDHRTPLEVRTHTPEPVPFVIWDSRRAGAGATGFNEDAAQATGIFEPNGHRLMERLIKGS